jgi:hypothetical protein
MIKTKIAKMFAGNPTAESVTNEAGQVREVAHSDFTDFDWKLMEKVGPFTMTSYEKRYNIIYSIRHISKYAISGAIVECGVWRGGSMMLAMLALNELKSYDREFYLYDTFEGMSAPSVEDLDFRGLTATERLSNEEERKSESHVWAIAHLDEVKHNIQTTGYPEEKVHFIQGKVEETIPSVVPDKIAILRLDTDWYESTKHELEHLYHLVSPGGVIILDDYGYWQGAKKAVDEFIKNSPDMIYLNRIDHSGYCFIKPF